MQRSPAPLASVQIVAALLMVVCLAGIFVISVAPSFSARTLEIHGATFTSPSVIHSILGMDGTPNVFRIDTERAAEQLVRLPAVQSASVQIRLPSTVVVHIVEREPKLVWTIGGSRYVVDQDGLLFGLVDSAGNPIASTAGPLPSYTPGASSSASDTTNDASPSSAPAASPSPTLSPSPKPTPTPKKSPTKPPTKVTPAPSAIGSAAESPGPTYDASLIPSLAPAPTADPAATSGPDALGLPVVFDRRASDAGLGFGGMIDEINLDAGYRLARLTPTDVGSKAAALAVVLDDEHGFTVSSVPEGWVAEFGFYASTVRQVTVIPQQVETLKSLLAAYGEAHVAWVWLVGDVSGNHVNTYLPR